jgi:hypothetical protein
MTARLTSTDVENDHCPACGKALSRLTTPPLPDEIAGLIDALLIFKSCPIPKGYGGIAEHTAAAIRALAQENERLHSQLDTVSETYNEVAREGNHRAARIRELEAELVTWKDIAVTIEKARDAIRSKTIEEMIEEFDSEWIKDRLHALAQMDEGKTEAGE